MSSSLIIRIARRFVFDRRANEDAIAQGFVSFIASISIAGLALGVTALLVVTSVMNGFESQLKASLTAFHGHVILFSRAEPVAHSEHFIDEVKTSFKDVVAVTPYIFSEVMLSSAKGIAGSVVEGIDLQTFSSVSAIPSKIIEGHLPEVSKYTEGTDQVEERSEITLGSELARKLKATVGDHITVTVPFAGENSQPLVRRARVAGIMKLGHFEYDSKYALMEISALQSLLKLEGRVNAFKILTKDAAKSQKITAALNDRYVYPLRARDWSSINQNLFYAIRLEKVVIALILMAIILVASFNIISTLIMMVHEKRRQVAMLKALGFRPRATFVLFLLLGGGLSFCGTLLRLGLGRALCAIVAWKSIIDLPADIYLFSRLPVEIRAWEWSGIAFVSVGLALLSTLLPSYRISRELPARGLHYE